MASLLNRKIAYLTIKPGTITNSLLSADAVQNVNMLDATLGFEKTQDAFAAALLDTFKRVVLVWIGGTTLTLPAANTMNVSTQMAGVAVSAAAPSYNSGTRTWTNLGAATYVGAGNDAGNKVLLRVPGPSGAPDATDPLKDAAGNEVYGKLTNTGGSNGTWTLSFYHAPSGVEAAYTLPNMPSVYAYFRQWVSGSSQLLEDQGRIIISSPGAVDITENNNIQQLAADLGITLSNNGSASLGISVIGRINQHVLGAAERHSTADIDVEVGDGVVVSGFATGTLAAILSQLQTNITAAASAAEANLETYTHELRSNGIVGISDPLVDNGDNTVSPVAARFAYVAGKRFAIPVAPVSVPDTTSRYFWVDAAGTVQTGVAYPGSGEFAKLGKATNTGGVITFSMAAPDLFLPLVQLDQKVLDTYNLLTAHIASTAAHAAVDITFDPTGTGLKTPGNVDVANVQEAIVAIDTRIDAIQFGFYRHKLVAGDISGAVAAPSIGANIAYIEIVIPGSNGTYMPARNVMVVSVDGDPQDLLAEYEGVGNGYSGAFTEPANDRIRLYYDTVEQPLEAGQAVSLRWLVTTP